MTNPIDGKRVLLVEDENLVLMMMEDLVADFGAAEILTASSLPAGLKAAEAPIDFALLDVNLAGARSYPIAERLRDRGVAFAFVTGYGTGIHEGCWTGWPTADKPVNTQRLFEVVAAALAKSPPVEAAGVAAP